MHTDIHMCLEQRTIEHGWVMIKHQMPDCAQQRNYRRFAALAGVRGDGPEPRGIPADVSPGSTVYLKWEAGHSHSWASIQEAAAIFLETADPAIFYPQGVRAIQVFFEIRPQEPLVMAAKYRLVYWFSEEGLAEPKKKPPPKRGLALEAWEHTNCMLKA